METRTIRVSSAHDTVAAVLWSCRPATGRLSVDISVYISILSRNFLFKKKKVVLDLFVDYVLRACTQELYKLTRTI